MKTNFHLTNLLGTVYCKGNLLFTPDGKCLLSPVGNRVTVFDLINDKSDTFPFAHRRNISCIALNPHGNLLLSVDEDGKAILAILPRRLALHHFSFKSSLSALAFSPSGRYFAAAIDNLVEVWHTPDLPDATAEGLAFAPFVLHSSHGGHDDQILNVEWSKDSRFFLSSSRDLTARIWSLEPKEGFSPTPLERHREAVLGAWFSADQENIYTISRDGALFEWSYTSQSKRNGGNDLSKGSGIELRWRISHKHYFNQQNAKVKCAAYHAESNLMVAGFSTGLFCLYELPDFNMIHTLSISQSNIDVVCFNRSAEWLAFGSSHLGQLLIWEWQSESYILKQQGHHDSITDIAYSPDGQRVITTADDGKIKVWDAQSGFCIVTFTEHSSSVTACQFTSKGSVLFTSSLDGSVRAWDLIRYRNFRTFSAAIRMSFSSVAVDPNNEVVCAGSKDSFDIHIWSVQTGQLLDRLSGHVGPVASLAFAPSGDQLASGSWDQTVRLWSIFKRTQTSESLMLQAEVLAVAFRPDSKQIAVSTLDGQLTFWSVSEATQELGLDGRRDVSGGRKNSDRRTAANTAGTKAFTSVVYSADGSCVIAGGNSKYICLYDFDSGVLLRKFTVSMNLSLQGTQDFLNSRNLTEAGPIGLLDEHGQAEDLDDRLDQTLPGARRGDASFRRVRPEVRVTALAVSPTGKAFCAASTEGLLIYSTDSSLQFDPFDLEVDVTPSATMQAVKDKDYLRALVLAFRLNERSLIHRVYEATPIHNVALVLKQLPVVYLSRLIRFIVQESETNPRLEFCLRWVESLLSVHGAYLKANAVSKFASESTALQRALAKIQADLASMADDNIYTLKYILSCPPPKVV